MPDIKLRMTYNSIASLYEKARPLYPDNMIDLILKYSNLKHEQIILDIGCGTGKGIYPFLKRGYSAYCIDIGEEMISEARSTLSDFKNTVFEVVKFEDWRTNRDCKMNSV
jgi:SAM-dependent methyltransferase